MLKSCGTNAFTDVEAERVAVDIRHMIELFVEKGPGLSVGEMSRVQT